MSKNNNKGICRLCGQYKKLTFEHVPPESAFNNFPVKHYRFDSVIQMMRESNSNTLWNTDGKRYEPQQRGSGGYYLCSSCNNNTGSWYISDYTYFIKCLHEVIVTNQFSTNNFYTFSLHNIYPLRIFKAIMVMFCDINKNLYRNDSIKDFLLDKESSNFDTNKYSIYIYLIKSSMRRITPISIKATIPNPNSITMLSEISSYPFGVVLYINKPEFEKPTGICINDFLQYEYSSMGELTFNQIPYYEVNTIFPDDFRSKQQIFHQRKQEQQPCPTNQQQ